MQLKSTVGRLAMDYTNPKCPVCGKPICSGETVVFDHGDLVHTACDEKRDPGPAKRPT